MTYEELLKTTAEKKREAVRTINRILNDNSSSLASELAKAEILRNPGTVAWTLLAKDFCETLAENFGDIMDSLDDYDKLTVAGIYMAYEDGRTDLYDLLPVEAQLFEQEA